MEKTSWLRWKWWLPPLLIIIVAAGYTGWSLKRPLPRLKPDQSAAQIKAKVPGGTLAWPAGGQAAVGIPGTHILEIHGEQKPLPIASTAKLITALTVLRQKPLKPDEQGPMITLADRDVALYNSYLAQGGSVVRVTAGEKISEYQMLQAIMLPSANNMADSLAIWAFGSLDAYGDEADKYVRQLGLHDTRVGTDASGLASSSTSTAHDLAKLGEAAMENPVLAQIVGQETASGLPIVNNIKNVNFLLGTDNIVGIKTGNTEEAGGVFVGAAKTTVNGKPVTIVTAVLGSPTLFIAMKDSLNLIRSAQNNFKPVTLVRAGVTVGSYKVPWGGSITAVVGGNLDTAAWGGSIVTANASLKDIPPDSRGGETVGSIKISNSTLTDEKSVDVKLSGTPAKPSAWWRLTHPLQ
jgi:D-alanyl-D-alanine carboxypeptidase (penicillin-binding protein 5/6)